MVDEKQGYVTMTSEGIPNAVELSRVLPLGCHIGAMFDEEPGQVHLWKPDATGSPRPRSELPHQRRA